jgi:hypothetical protein
VSDTVLPPWRDGATRAAIISFLDRVDEIPPRDRVAVFDNDGTPWAEKPNYTQLDFMVHELKAAVASRPDLAYESVAGSFAADESITDTAARLGWTVSSIKNDWSTVYASS